jgi:hypothetical protein
MKKNFLYYDFLSFILIFLGYSYLFYNMIFKGDDAAFLISLVLTIYILKNYFKKKKVILIMFSSYL